MNARYTWGDYMGERMNETRARNDERWNNAEGFWGKTGASLVNVGDRLKDSYVGMGGGILDAAHGLYKGGTGGKDPQWAIGQPAPQQEQPALQRHQHAPPPQPAAQPTAQQPAAPPGQPAPSALAQISATPPGQPAPPAPARTFTTPRGQMPLPQDVREKQGSQGERMFTNLPDGVRADYAQSPVRPSAIDPYRPQPQQRGVQTLHLPQNPFNDRMMSEHERLSQILERGLTSNRPGERLTADGISAIAGRLRSIEQGALGHLSDNTSAAQGIINRQLQNQGSMDVQALQGQNSLRLEGVRGQNTIDAEWQRALAGIVGTDATGGTDLNFARAQALQEKNIQPVVAQGHGDMPPTEQQQLIADTANTLLAGLVTLGSPEAMAAELQGIIESGDADEVQLAGAYAAMDQLLPLIPIQPQSYADGGLVAPPPDAIDPMMGATPSADPMMGGMAMQAYQQYLNMARKMGLPPVEFDQFLAMQSQQGQAPGGVAMPEMQQGAPAAGEVMGFAGGGMVPEMGALEGIGGPQVDGKMVVDPDPMAPTDSIPAMIDGQHPAALDSGEMVLPKDVVMYYGTQKLQQMIEKARGGGAKPAAAAGGM